MFDIFRKQSTPSDEPKSAPEAGQLPSQSDYAERKRIALAEAAALPDDEAAVLDFILRCEFADARLQAAQSVHSKPAAEKLLQAMRNNDRRVAKLMQTRLDAMHAKESTSLQAERCIAAARALLAETFLSPNQVGELDREWESIQDAPQSEKEIFSVVRAGLRDRLEAQAALQRATLDALAELRKLASADTAASADELAQGLRELESKMAAYRVAPEAPMLPKNLLTEFAQIAGALGRSLEDMRQQQQAWSSAEERLAAWEAADLNSLKPEVLKREWKDLSPLPEAAPMAPLQPRFDALLKRLGEARNVVSGDAERDKKEKKDLLPQAGKLLEKMEAALEEGALQLAAEQDKSLRLLDSKAAALRGELSARLAKARAELKRLQGWARWGGHVSREELLHAAEAMAGQKLAPPELAKKVGSLRERWKSLDISAGPSGKELWQRFDQACTTAYAPAAAHFKQQAEERKRNAAKAQALIDEIKQLSKGIEGDGAVDWKAVAACMERSKQAWHRLGGIDRKEKKRLDGEFDAGLKTLAAPLAQQRGTEAARREQLIAEAERLDPKDRALPEALRALQERWQQQAKALPLDRKSEQALWQRFRQACDQAFDARKAAAQAMDTERRARLHEKEQWCAQLESAQDLSEDAIRKLLRDAANAWERIGPVPRAAEPQLEARYRKAVENLRKRSDEHKRKASAARYDALTARLKLCATIEESLANQGADAGIAAGEIAAAWEAAPETFDELKRDLQARFQAGLAALQAGDRGYAARLDQNRSALMRELLRLEILFSVRSPAEFAQERLRLQVEVLQSALKNGQGSPARQKGGEVFRDLVRLAAVPDEQTAARIHDLIAHGKS